MTQEEKLTALLREVTVGGGKYTLKDFLLPESIERVSKQLIESGVIAPPLSVGDTVYIILDDDMVEDGKYIYPHRVTEVGSRGFWLSAYDPPKDDMSDFFSWSEFGMSVFKAYEETKRNL